ncbi:MAG TPA: PAS domain S-box protein [Pirellulales bacterium]|nr:PAS domain S-box protein [Pirellulales bacterium]
MIHQCLMYAHGDTKKMQPASSNPPHDNSEPFSTPVELQFREILDRFPAGAYICDANGLITYFNAQAVELWGRQPKLNDPVDRFCGSFKLFLADGTPVPHDQCWMALGLQTGKAYIRQEIIIERPDGFRSTVLAHVSPLHDASGKLTGALNVLIDITEQAHGTTAQALLAAIVKSSDDAIISKTLEGRILSWNAGAERIFGYSAKEAIGQPITLIIPPERQHEETAIIEKIGRGERIDHFETVRIAKNGRRLDISLAISSVRDRSGHIVGASKVARDITERKLVEAALRESEQRFANFMQYLPGLAWIKDSNGRYVFVNDAAEKAFGRTKAELLGKSDRDIFPPEIAAQFCENDHRALSAGAGVETVEALQQVDGVHHSIVSKFPIPAADGKPTMVGGMAIDITQRVKAEQALRDLDSRKDEFLATLAHELRNPLAPISNSLHILRMSGELSPTTERVCGIMERQVNHLVRLVDDLLEVSRITRNKIELRKESVELAAILRSAIETSMPLLDAAGHQLAISVPTEPILLQADPLRLAQVVANLLNNAAKYTPHGGQVWINGRQEGQLAVVSVRDNGLGIAPDMLSKVFNMFAQGEQTLDRAHGGLGIGLTLAKNLVQLHDGKIEAFSAGLGKGSEFVVRLPLAQAAPLSPVQVTPALGDKAATPPRRIMIVDDTRDSVFVLGKLLEKLGHRVSINHDAATALQNARRERPDMIISDIAMPKMDGYEFARRVRQEPDLVGVVLVALSGYGQESHRKRAKEAGFNYHLIKPISLEDLEKVISFSSADEATAGRVAQ